MTRRKIHTGIAHIVVSTEGRLFKDYTGKVAGYFTVIKHIGFNYMSGSVYLVRDIFGDEFPVSGTQIVQTYFGSRFYTEESKLKNKRLSTCYRNMIKRCYDSSRSDYKCYGGKGVKICKDWLGPTGKQTFITWAVSSGYSLGLTIDRLFPDKDYEALNCVWIPMQENRLKRRNVFLTKEKAILLREEFSNLTKKERKQFYINMAEQLGCTPDYVRNLCLCRNYLWN